MASSNTPRDALQRAERRLIRAAMGCVNAQGYSFAYAHGGLAVAHFPDSLHRLETAVANLRSVRAHIQKAKRRKHG